MQLNIDPIHIVCVLDESGSMSGSQEQVIKSFNDIISKHREAGGDAYVSLYKFGGAGVNSIFSKRHINEVVDLTPADYVPAGGTPLNDAIGKAVEDHRGLKRVFFVVDTDGYENTSREYNQANVKSLIEEQKNVGWDFTFVGADLTQAATQTMSASFGISASDTMAFAKGAVGYASRTAALNAKLDAYTSMSVDSVDWSQIAASQTNTTQQ